eukprot:TRINITY_DN4213_c0_g1_i1.p1 TRINITY_DN4213_c0_g1~~TRINITY_DN4213_c0_g1_i1.p1  ORF type:complete len:223 (+),score=50.43 TRINITY_DN4213_c0_g1_i1:816-1484(+)
MSWRSSGSSNAELVQNLHSFGLFTHDSVGKALNAVDRANFAPQYPYEDRPMPIGFGVTISAPHMHAACLELLANHLKPGAHALDVGCGSGFLTAAMATLVGDNGKVIGIDYQNGLVQMSHNNILKGNRDLLDKKIVELKVADGWKGDAANGPYDAIHVGAQAEDLPQALVDQLKIGGRLVIPVGAQFDGGRLLVIDKQDDGSIRQETAMHVQYVPLVKLGEE